MLIHNAQQRGGGGGGGGTLVTASTVNVPSWRKALLATSGGVLALALAAINPAAAVTITKTGATPGTLSHNSVYVAGSAVVPAPSAAYTGPETTGWTAWVEDGNAMTLPPDKSTAQGNGTGALGNEARVTAQPALVLFTVPHQRFDTSLVLMIKSDACCGLTKVRVYCEGTYIDLTTQTNYRYIDVNGVERWFYGYICELNPANYTGVSTDALRGVQVMIRAYPNNTQAAAMGLANLQTQLIGSATTRSQGIYYYPGLQPYGYMINVDPNGVDSKTGTLYDKANPQPYATFTTFTKAQNFAGGTVTSGFTNPIPGLAPLIRFIDNVVYDVVGGTNFNTGTRGYMTIDCVAGKTATFGHTVFSTVGWVPGYLGLRFKGQNIIFDATNLVGFGTFPSTSDRYWYWADGCTVTCQFDMSTTLDAQHQHRMAFQGPNVSFLYQTDAHMKYTPGSGSALNRNNLRGKSVANDLYNGSNTYGDVVDGLDDTVFRTLLDALNVVYSGAGTTFAVGYSANNSTAGNFLLYVDSVQAQSIAVTGTTTIAQLVSAIGGFASWAATSLVTPNDGITDRAAWSVTPGAGFSQNAWTGTNTPVGGTYKVSTFIDIHLDVYQTGASLPINRYLGHIRIFNSVGVQTVFNDGSGSKDCVYEYLWTDENQNSIITSSIGKMAHVILRGYSVAGQPIKLTNSTGWADTYCVFELNVWQDLTWGTPSTATAFPQIVGSHFVAFSGAGAGASVNINDTIGGGASITTLYPGALSKNVLPGGTLLTNTIARAGHGANEAQFAANDVKGAVPAAVTAVTTTAAVALNEAFISEDTTVANGVGTVSFSFTNASGQAQRHDVTINVAQAA